jgi:hypothetical protein
VNTDTLGQLLVDLLSASGTVPKKVKFHDFTLTYRGE